MPSLRFRFDGQNEAAQAVARRQAAKLITSEIPDGTRAAVRELIASSIRDGVPPFDSARTIRGMVGMNARQAAAAKNFRRNLIDSGLSMSRVDVLSDQFIEKKIRERSMMIARTETIDSLAAGVQESWEQAQAEGLLDEGVMKEVILGPDPCPICLGIQAVGPVPVNKPFPGGKMSPTFHPNCVCAMGIVEVSAAERGDIIGQPTTAYPAANPDALETMDRFKLADGTWTAERQQLHDAIINKKLEGFTRVENPITTVMGGGPASGKSTMMKKIAGLPRESKLTGIPPNTVLIDVDDLRTLLPEFKRAIGQGNAAAASMTHEEASFLSKVLADRVGLNGFNAVMDGTGDASLAKLSGKIAGYRARGSTRVVGQYITVDTEVAVQRMLERAARSGRYVPEGFMREVHSGVSKVVPEALEKGLFDDFTLWDNNGADIFKILTHTDGTTVIHNQAAYRRFLAK